MRVGICTGIENLPMAREAGYAYVEINAGMMVADKPEADFAPTRAAILEAPLGVEAMNCFLPGSLKVAGPAVDLQAVGAYMDTLLCRAGEINAKIVVFGSGGARSVPEGFSLDTALRQYADAAKLAGEIAAKYGVTICMEPLGPKECRYFNRVSQGAAIVDQVNLPSLRVLADTYHMNHSGEGLESLTLAGKERLGHVHISSVKAPGLNGGHDYDYPAFFAALKQIGYDQRVSLEDHCGLVGGEQPVDRLEVWAREREAIEGAMGR